MNEQIKAILSELFNVPAANISDTFAMADTESWDSLRHMELIVSLENEFNIQLTADEITEMLTFEKIAAILNSKGVLA